MALQYSTDRKKPDIYTFPTNKNIDFIKVRKAQDASCPNQIRYPLTTLRKIRQLYHFIIANRFLLFLLFLYICVC